MPDLPARGPAFHALVVDADPALAALIGEWLEARGGGVALESGGSPIPREALDLIVADLPFPRERGLELLERLARDYPGVPVLAVSSAFFPRVGATGGVARSLGVAGVLPKPLTRQALDAAVGRLVPAAA